MLIKQCGQRDKMCGRYTVTSSPKALRDVFGYDDMPNFPARYNIAPTQPIAIVRLENGKRRFALVRWGLLPSWVKDPRAFSLIINARGESVLDKPAFKNAMRYRRCLIPADGFYDWKRDGSRSQPYYVRPANGGPIAYAGLWECWTGPNGEEVETAAIITTRANRMLAGLHERAPVIIPPEAFDLWLDCVNVDAETAATLIAPCPDDLLVAHPVSPAVNNVANDGPQLIAPFEPPVQQVPPSRPASRRAAKKNDQPSLF